MIDPASTSGQDHLAVSAGSPLIETEVRYRLPHDILVKDRLAACGARAMGTVKIVDTWYAPLAVIDYHSHEEWLAQGGIPLRIREQPGHAAERLTIEVKRPLVAQSYTHSVEARLSLASVSQGHAFASAFGYHPLARLVKRRHTWSVDEIVVAHDRYDDNTEILELELVAKTHGPTDPLLDLATRLGLPTLARLKASSALTLIRERLASGPESLA